MTISAMIGERIGCFKNTEEGRVFGAGRARKSFLEENSVKDEASWRDREVCSTQRLTHRHEILECVAMNLQVI